MPDRREDRPESDEPRETPDPAPDRPRPYDRRQRFRDMPSPPPEREWSTVAHVGVLAGIILPFGAVLPAIFVLGIKGRDPYIRVNALEAINLGINYEIPHVALLLLGGSLPTLLGLLLTLALMIPVMTLAIVGGVRAYRGEATRYPVPLRLIRRGG